MARHLITSALPYVNGIKHLGNLVGSMLPADVYARFLRQQGHDVLYICATDEHGTPTEIAAAKEGISPQELCDKNHVIQKNIYENFGLKFDWFGRTSRPQNHELTQHFFNKLDENGFIEQRSFRQLYSNADQRFLPDRYVEGTCPNCGFDDARGDQCDNCGKVLDPTELINPRSAISGSTDIEERETQHFYLLQSKLAKKLDDWIKSTSWSPLVKGIANKWLHDGDGLQDRGITRDLKWGVPVPRAGFEDKVFYVWFDAPIGYISATKELSDSGASIDWQSWWRNDKGASDVTYTQFMGKDNIPFHTLSFPATEIGSGEDWHKVDTIKGFSWLTYYGGKFSTSRGVGVFTNNALDILPADYWRYYLMARVPESDDSAFTWEDLQSVVNKDLADVLGNYVNRLTKFTEKKFGAVIPEGGEFDPENNGGDLAFLHGLTQHVAEYKDYLQQLEFRKAMSSLRAIFTAGNEYLAKQAPWDVIKTDEARAAAILRTGLNFINILAQVSAPVIPFAAEKLATINGTDLNAWPNDVKETLGANTGGQPFQPLDGVLFKKIEDEQIAEWKVQFKAPA